MGHILAFGIHLHRPSSRNRTTEEGPFPRRNNPDCADSYHLDCKVPLSGAKINRSRLGSRISRDGIVDRYHIHHGTPQCLSLDYDRIASGRVLRLILCKPLRSSHPRRDWMTNRGPENMVHLMAWDSSSLRAFL
jgi:hypothetical protein